VPLGRALFDPSSGTITQDGVSQLLRNRELRLLEVFARNKGQILSKSQLLDRLFSQDAEVTENAIEVYVGRLRKRLQDAGVHIETVRGVGYRMIEP
jgi:DNA-binding response OmpR family regulator